MSTPVQQQPLETGSWETK